MDAKWENARFWTPKRTPEEPQVATSKTAGCHIVWRAIEDLDWGNSDNALTAVNEDRLSFGILPGGSIHALRLEPTGHRRALDMVHMRKVDFSYYQ